MLEEGTGARLAPNPLPVAASLKKKSRDLLQLWVPALSASVRAAGATLTYLHLHHAAGADHVAPGACNAGRRYRAHKHDAQVV